MVGTVWVDVYTPVPLTLTRWLLTASAPLLQSVLGIVG